IRPSLRTAAVAQCVSLMPRMIIPGIIQEIGGGPDGPPNAVACRRTRQGLGRRRPRRAVEKLAPAEPLVEQRLLRRAPRRTRADRLGPFVAAGPPACRGCALD